MDHQLVISLIILVVGCIISTVGVVISVLSKRAVRSFDLRQDELEKRADRIRDDFEDRCTKIDEDQQEQDRHINGLRVTVGVLRERTKNL